MKTAARNFIERYFPTTSHDPSDSIRDLGGEAHGAYRADVYLVSEHGVKTPYTVFSELRHDSYVPLLVSELPHIPYSESQRGWAQTDDSIGLFVQIESVYEPRATTARFTLPLRAGPVSDTTLVAEHHAVYFHWDSRWLTFAEQAKLQSLLIDGTWLETVSPILACRPSTFAAAYNASLKGDVQADWAADALEALGATEYFPLALALLEELNPSQTAYRHFIETSLSQMLNPQLETLIAADLIHQDVWQQALSKLATDKAASPQPRVN